MDARHRSFAGLLAAMMVCALLPASVAANELVPGRPGRYELSSITIDATSGDCRATYETPAMGNLWMRGVDATVRVLTTPRGLHVSCRFTDMSQLIELNAEVGYTDACDLVTETMTFSGGRGIATSAANISERTEGGTSMILCRFESEAPTATEAAVGSPTRDATPSTTGPQGHARLAAPTDPRVTTSHADNRRSHRSDSGRGSSSAVTSTPKSRSTTSRTDSAANAKGVHRGRGRAAGNSHRR